MLENTKYPYCYRVRKEIVDLYKCLSGDCKVALRGLPHTFYLELATSLIKRTATEDDPLNILIGKVKIIRYWRDVTPEDKDALLDIIEEEIIRLLTCDPVLYNNITIPKVLKERYTKSIYWIISSLTPFTYEVQKETR